MSFEMTLKDEAIRIDNEIQMWASQINTAVYNIGRNLSIMKEKELFRELGYESFNEYTEQKYKLKHSQSAKYISVFKNLGEQYILENQNAGIQKLYMISQISEEDREAVEADLNDVPVTELKAEIERIKQEREGIQMELFDMKQSAEEKIEEEVEKRAAEKANELSALENIAAKKRIEELTQQLEEAQKESQSYKKQSDKAAKLEVDKETLETKIAQQEKKIKELESKPQDVVVQEPSEHIVREKANELIADEIEKFEAKLKEKEQELENIRAGYEKKIENLTASAEQKAESTQVEAEPEEDETAKMKKLITAVVVASNEVLDAANLSENPDFWIEKLRGVFESITAKLKGTAL